MTRTPRSHSKPPQPLTPNEKKVLEYIEGYLVAQGFAPSYQEIKSHFHFASFNSVQRYLKQLEGKGYLHTPGDNRKRAITLLHSAGTVQSSLEHLKQSPEVLTLPLLGRVAAGLPIEEIEYDEFFEVPTSLVRKPSKTFALRVKGQSMIEDGIFDGDVILVQRQDSASNGDTVVAMVDNEATVKRIYFHQPQVELRPANATMSSLWYRPDQVKVQGVIVGLIRQF